MKRAAETTRVLETPRLALRRLSLDDAGFILELLNDPEFLRYVGDKGVRSHADACRYITTGPIASYERFGFGLYRMGLKPTAEPIGICGLLKRDSLEHPDVGFALLRRFRTQGYALEAATAVLAEARHRFGIERVLAITSPDNVSSIRLLAKLGFGFERLAAVHQGEPEVKVFAASLAAQTPRRALRENPSS